MTTLEESTKKNSKKIRKTKDEALEKKREQNRESASRCRKRQADLTESLRNRVEELQKEL